MLERSNQDVEVKDMADFLEPEFNHLNRQPMAQPMATWLSKDSEENQRNRLTSLGNVVVPQCGALALNLLHRMMQAMPI